MMEDWVSVAYDFFGFKRLTFVSEPVSFVLCSCSAPIFKIV